MSNNIESSGDILWPLIPYQLILELR